MKMRRKIGRGVLARLMAAAGFIWILFAVALLLFAAEYLAEGAGRQLFGFLHLTSGIAIGWVHLMGFFLGAGICFAIGVGLCAHGLVPADED